MTFKATFRHSGPMIDHTPDAAVSAGDVIVIAGIVAIAHNDIAEGVLGALSVSGIYDVEKDNSEITEGAALYFDEDGNPVDGTAGSGAFSTTSGGNTFAGYALADAGAAATHVRMLLIPAVAVTANQYGPLNNAIADPGDAEAIPVTASGTVALVTAGAETRTLAAPTFVGQELLIFMKTDGGDGVLTIATGMNQAGNDTATFADEGDTLRLVGIDVDGDLRWRVIGNDGAALSTA